MVIDQLDDETSHATEAEGVIDISSSFATIFGNTRHGRLAADPIHSGNHDRIEFYDGIEQTAAETVLGRWRRDAGFLYAIKLLDQAA